MADFTTALARLLSDGELRDAFARDPEAVADLLEVSPLDREAFCQLVASDLEAQAEVLLRKRFEGMGGWLGKTCAALPEDGWFAFRTYARPKWSDSPGRTGDALAFSQALRVQGVRTERAEVNRLKFAEGVGLASIHFLPSGPSRRHGGFQAFIRGKARTWREWEIHFRL